MSSPYPKDVIYTKDGKTILLKFVESFTFERDEAGELIDKLKDDYTFNVRTISGEDYELSTNHICKLIGATGSPIMIASHIYEKWLWIHKFQEKT